MFSISIIFYFKFSPIESADEGSPAHVLVFEQVEEWILVSLQARGLFTLYVFDIFNLLTILFIIILLELYWLINKIIDKN